MLQPLEEPAADVLPASQFVHDAAPEAAYLPAAHVMLQPLGEPARDVLPVSQFAHEPEPAADVLPASQFEHDGAPEAAYLPISHVMLHEVAAVVDVLPAGQELHPVVPVPGLAFPGAHASQTLSPFESLYPGEHVHALDTQLSMVPVHSPPPAEQLSPTV